MMKTAYNDIGAAKPSSAPAISPPRSTGEGYKPQLDGVRAFCIIFTIMEHVPGKPWWVNGSIGVDIFFALSGWLITWLLLSEYWKNKRISLLGFYIRRGFRIVPLYLFAILLYLGLTEAGAKASGATEFRAAFPFMLTFNMEYHPAAAGNLFGQAWTLGIEEKFYLVWPFILAFTVRRPLVGASVAGICVAVLMMGMGVNDMVIRGYAGLGAGAALAIVTHRNPGLRDWWGRAPAADGFLGVMALLYLGSILVRHPFIWNVGIALGATGFIASLWLNGKQRVGGYLAQAPLPWLGRLTYAIYLLQAIIIRLVEAVLGKLHVPLDGVALFPFVYAACVGAAWVAHVAVEKPMIIRGKRLAEVYRARNA
jgi:peptidoglycan/LPS O-acetylase OafA/YrhL